MYDIYQVVNYRHANGNTRDRQARLLTCESGGQVALRRVRRDAGRADAVSALTD